jgi:hypothetical protein
MYRAPVDIEAEDLPRWRFRHGRRAAQTAAREPRVNNSPPARLSRHQQHALGLYDEIEQHRTGMHDAFHTLIKYVQAHPELRPAWDRFISTGGATSYELKQQFQRHGRPGQVVRRGLLRVVGVRERGGRSERV